MKDYGEFKLFTVMKEIREIQSVKAPSADDIRLAKGNEGICKGWTVAVYDRRKEEFQISTQHKTEEECMEWIRKRKELSIAFPECFGNWYTEIGDIYIYLSDSWYRSNWGLHGIVIED